MYRNHIVGVFADREHAVSAMQSLQSIGIDSSSMVTIDDARALQPSGEGRLSGFFHRLFASEPRGDDRVPREWDDAERRFFQREVEHGKILIVVSEQVAREPALRRSALEIMDRQGGLEPFEREAGGERAAGEEVLRLRKDVLDIETREVPVGEVSVRKETHTRTEELEVPVSREEVVIERRAAGEAQGAVEREELRIPVAEEKVEVRKETVPKEDVTVRKERVHGTETVAEEVREEELEVEREGEARVRRGSDVRGERRRPPRDE